MFCFVLSDLIDYSEHQFDFLAHHIMIFIDKTSYSCLHICFNHIAQCRFSCTHSAALIFLVTGCCCERDNSRALHRAAHLHVLDRLLAYCCHLHHMAHRWLEHPEKRQVIKDVNQHSLLPTVIVQFRPPMWGGKPLVWWWWMSALRRSFA